MMIRTILVAAALMLPWAAVPGASAQDGFRQDEFRQDGFRQDGFRQDGLRQDGYRQAPEQQNSETPEEQQACMYDAFRVCGHAIPSRERVIACFRDNLDDLSPLCRQVMLRYNKPAPRQRNRVSRTP